MGRLQPEQLERMVAERSGILNDGTRWQCIPGCGCCMPVTHCRGGQHVGPGSAWVILTPEHGGAPLALQAGHPRSTFHVAMAVSEATVWAEVPLLIEATRWRSLMAAAPTPPGSAG